MSWRRTGIIFFLTTLIFMSCSVRLGLDNANRKDFSEFKGMNVAIVANHTSVDRNGDHIVDLIYNADDVNLKAIMAPEHGFRGDVEAGEHIDKEIDERTGVPVMSIYGRTRKPTPEMLEGVDVLVFDIQDIGARFYTYISTMFNVMEAGAENDIPVYVLDRPNPIGRLAEGPVMKDAFVSFVGRFAIPLRHGMTVGELALMIKDQGWINEADKLELHVVECSGWNPGKSYEKTNIEWIPPSPNIRNLNQALVYPGTCLFEACNFSEGRGTVNPFEWVGAPYVDPEALIAELRKRDIKGLDIQPVNFTPENIPGAAMNPKYMGELCHGIQLKVTDPVHFRSVEFGMYLIDVLMTMYPDDFRISRPDWLNALWGNRDALDMLREGKHADEIIEAYREELETFNRLRKKYLLY
jgi:uncharacterized protein YbbC (DUF1343 family)